MYEVRFARRDDRGHAAAQQPYRKNVLQAAIDRRDFDETVKLSKALQQMYYSNNKREGEL